MPISQHDRANSETDRKKELAALALLLSRSKRRYSLLDMIAAQGIRPRRFRMIRTTQALASNMAAPHFAIVNAWAAALPDILDAVPFGQSAVAAAIERTAGAVPVYQSKAMIPRSVDSVERFHRAAWISRVRGATGLDVSTLTHPSDVADPVAATTAWSQALADDVHGQIKGRMMAGLLVGGLLQSDAKALAGDVIAKARRRSAGIGADQAVKLSRGMDRARREAAGIDKFMWFHGGSAHPRAWHLTRSGQTFSEGDISPDDRAGIPPFCSCYEVPVLG